MPTLNFDLIPEVVVPGKRLGRHKGWDSRSLAYPVPPRDAVLLSKLWPSHNAVLDQGELGSCTGNAEVNALATDPLFSALPTVHPELNEALAVQIYERATVLDPYDGGYPPDDTGSDGISASKAAKGFGWISGYTHATTLRGMQAALQSGPGCFGLHWYDSFDSPSSSGEVTISPNAEVRGGHEVCIRGIDVERKLFRCVNSWTTDYGDGGYFDVGFDLADRLLHEDGDLTVPLPLSVPAPTPIPVPVPPVPPVPDPTVNPDTVFAAELHKWLLQRRYFYKSVQTAATTWMSDKHL